MRGLREVWCWVESGGGGEGGGGDGVGWGGSNGFF